MHIVWSIDITKVIIRKKNLYHFYFKLNNSIPIFVNTIKKQICKLMPFHVIDNNCVNVWVVFSFAIYFNFNNTEVNIKQIV